jgi:DNA (cytosine-5)-methyltransferase 1
VGGAGVKTIFIADHFCGAGGTSTGVAEACEELGLEIDMLAVNHWQVAIDTHTKAHPKARHVCASLTHVKPRTVVPGGRLHLLVASPECTSHSIAKGGRPRDEQSRATAWDVLKWLQELYVDNLIIENVKEFRKWGPLGANGKALKSKQGETYRGFLECIRSLGYRVEDRVLNCADFGAPTSRERLFIIARRGNKKIFWPEPTHSRTGRAELFGSKKKHRTAREIIDWSIPNPSIFTRTRPLKPKTMRRILTGMAKINPQLAPFLVHLRGQATGRSLDEPIPTLTAGGGHLALCEPMILGQQSGSEGRSVSSPLPTISTAGAIALIEPILVTVNHGEGCETRRSQSVDEPLKTVTTKNGVGVAEAFILPQFGEAEGRSIDRPLGTVTTTSRGVGLVEPFIVPFFGERSGQTPRSHSVDDPIPTVTSHGAGGLVEPFIIPIDHTGSKSDGSRSTDQPLSTITTENRHGLVEPFLTKYYGTGTAATVDEPLDSVTCKDRFGLVQPEWNGYRLDIRFRMLQPHELAAAMTFPKNYPFTGTKSDVTKQIGNAVPPLMGRVLAKSLLEDYIPKRKKLADVVELESPERMEVSA